MSDNCFNIKIEEPSRNILHIENSVGDSTKNIDIIQSGFYNLQVSPCMAMLPSDFQTIVDAEISSFISAGSGINIISSTSGVIISALPVTSGNFQFLTVNGVDVSLSGHKHIYNDILDFANGVSGLLPLISGSNYITTSFNNNIYTISTTGLQPSGNYSIIGHTHVINDVTGLQTALDNKQPSGIYASGIHYHVSSDITNFNTSVSGLLPVKDITSGSGISVTNTSGIFNVAVTGQFGLTGEQVDDRVSNLLSSGYGISLNYDDNNDLLTISTTGLQPSGNYSVVGHSHVSSDITDFSSSVSGLLPVKSILSGSGISVTSIGSDFTIAVTGQFGLTGEQVDDRVSNLLVAGSYINLNYNDNSDILTINVSGVQPSGNYASSIHSHVANDITDFNTSVSGLLPLFSGISGVSVSTSGNSYTIFLSDPTIQLADITDLSANTRTFLLTSSSDNLRTIISDETGSGVLVFNNSPVFSGIPTVPTAASGTNTSQIASTQFVRTEIANLVDSAPTTLDTLNELAAALGDDANFSTTVTNSLAAKANLGGAIFTGPVTIPSGTGNFNTLTVNNIGVSVSGHTHTYSDITNFASGVSDSLTTALLAGSFIVLDYNSSLDTLTISASGLQPSGSYANATHSHGNITNNGAIGSTSGLLVVTNSGGILTTASGINSSYITNFNTAVSGLLPSVSGNGYINSSFNNNVYTITATGLQPSGNYSLVGHTHASSSITDFNSSVSGLLPVKNIIGGSGIIVGATSGDYTITAFGIAAASASSLITQAYNNTGATIPKMSVVYINGGNGNLPTIQLGIANGEAGSSKTYAITAEQILDNHSGDVVVVGALIDVNTLQFGVTEGTTLYLSPTTSGAITTTKPLAPNHMVSVGKIVRNHVNQGVIEVSIQNGFELYELHDVAVSGAIAGQFLQRNESGLWVPSSSGNFSTLQVNGTNVSVSGHTHTSSDITNFNSSVSGLLPTVANSGDNRILTSTGSSVGINAENNLTFNGSLLNVSGSGTFSSNITASGFVRSGGTSSQFLKADGSIDSNSYYLNSNPSGYTTNVGTVTNVSALTIGNTGTDVTSSVANPTSTPTITLNIPSASASNRGVLTSSDWTTFNNKQNALTNPITGTGASGYLSRFNSSTGLTNSIVFESGTRLGVNTITPSGALHVVGSGLVASVTGTVPNSLFHVYSATSGASIFNVEGTNGSLFSVDDNLSDTLMSVNNNAGLPVFEVFSDDRVVAGRFNQNDFVVNSSGNIGIGNSGDNSYKLNVTGSGNFTGEVLASGNITGRRLAASRSSGSEGGILSLAKPASGASTSGTFVNIDMFNNQLRIYEAGSPNRGYYLDITEANPSVATPLKTSHVAGSGISLDYNSPNNTLTINASTNIINSANLYLWSTFR